MNDQEFYAELDLDTEAGRARERASSDFVRFEGVLDLWRRFPGATCPLNEIGLRLGRWLKNLSSSDCKEASMPLLIAFDYSTDYELMEDALRSVDLWDQIREAVTPCNVIGLTGSAAGERAAKAYYESTRADGLGRHHALSDARALRSAHIAGEAAARALLIGGGK